MTDPGRTDAGPLDGEVEGQVSLEQLDDAVVIGVAGALDLALASSLRRAVERAGRLHPALLVVDLTAVTFLASVGMAELVRADRDLGARFPVRVVAAARVVRRPLELTRLTDELAVFETVPAALSAR